MRSSPDNRSPGFDTRGGTSAHFSNPQRRLPRKLILVSLLALVGGGFLGVVLLIDRPVRFVCGSELGLEVQYLGNKMADDRKRGRARNIWDLQAYNGRIYLGGGSTVQNAGPVNVWAYDPATARFHKAYTVPEEAIELFLVFDGDLYIPAADPTSGDINKFYRLSGGVWTQAMGGPELAHVRDLNWRSGKLVGVGNARGVKTKTSAIVSLDRGLTFQAATTPDTLEKWDNWFYSLFEYQGILFTSSLRLTPTRNETSILTFNDATNHFELNSTYSTDDFLPVTGDPTHNHTTMRLWMPVEYKDLLVYAVKTYCVFRRCYEDLYTQSYGFFVKAGLTSAPVPVTFPDGASVGEDVLVKDGVLYALANRRLAPDEHVIYVYRTLNPAADGGSAWEEVVHFTCSNKARSFEFLGSTLYLGLGHEHDEPIGISGALVSLVP